MNNPLASPDDLKIIASQQDNSPVVRFLRSKANLRFAVGDYLVRQHCRNEKWTTELISHVSEMPKRFRCIHIDEYGICYIKPLTSMGTELPTVLQLTEVNTWSRYVLDPDYADHMILSDEEKFDFSEQRKKEKARRDAITRKNKKIAIRMGNAASVDKLIKGLKQGDKIWHGSSVPEAATVEPITLVSFKEKDIGWDFVSRDTSRKKTLEISVLMGNALSNRAHTMSSEDFQFRVIYLQEPFSYETI